MNNRLKIARQLIKLARNLIQESTLSQQNILHELKKININEYRLFTQVHDGQWIAYPVNRNADLPDIYVVLKDGKLKCGYNFIDSEQLDYEGTPQSSIVGLLQEMYILKDKIDNIVVNLKNEQLDEEGKEGEGEGENGGEENGGEENGGSEDGGDEELDMDLDLDSGQEQTSQE